jgi:hypothetical protein
MTLILSGTNGLSDVDGTAATPAIRGTDTNTGIFFPAADTIAFSEGGAEIARFDSSGNLGIGTSSPSARLSVSDTANPKINLLVGTTERAFISYTTATTIASFDSDGDITLSPNNTEAVRVNAAGNLLVGTTSGGYKLTVRGASACASFQVTNTGSIIDFYANTSTYVGAITTNGSATSYGTASDYRLKENIAPMTGALVKVAQLNPVTYSWKSDGSASEGFIAHELAEVCPDAVSGEKDAVNEDGSIKPQGIDTSFLVATLTAAIQELKALVDTQASTITQLQADVAALKGTA